MTKRKHIYILITILLPIIMVVLAINHIITDRPGLPPDHIVFNTFDPTFKIKGFTEEDVLNSKILLFRGTCVIDSCKFEDMSKENNTYYTSFQFQRKDTIRNNDIIVLSINNKTYKMYDIEEVQIKTRSYYSQAPLRRYKLNDVECSVNWTIIDKDTGIYRNDTF